MRRMQYDVATAAQTLSQWCSGSTTEPEDTLRAFIPLAQRWYGFIRQWGDDFLDDFISDAAYSICRVLRRFQGRDPALILHMLMTVLRDAAIRTTRMAQRLVRTPRVPGLSLRALRDEGSIYLTELRILLREIPAAVRNALRRSSRLATEAERSAADYAVRQLLAKRAPSPFLMRSVWGIADPNFLISWTIAFYRKFVGKLLRNSDAVERYEFVVAA